MPGGGGVQVQEMDRSLKVQTEQPHLVSLGGGRLSTAVTLHPLPEGTRTLGSGPAADLQVMGTGVESTHCRIENRSGVVTIHPVAGSTAVDGLQVDQSTRLTQGCMICLGRSTCLRFNHPAEARLMKSVLPHSRISVVPFPFYTGDENSVFGSGVEGKPPPAPRRSGGSRDSWGDLSSASSEDLAKYISPKVFPPGSSTVNSPACVVLGSRPGTPSKLTAYSSSSRPNSNQSNNGGSEMRLSIAQPQTADKVPLTNGIRPQNGNVIYQNVVQMPNGRYTPSLHCGESNLQSPAAASMSPPPSSSSSCCEQRAYAASPSPVPPTPPQRTYSNSSTSSSVCQSPVFNYSSSNAVASPERGSSPSPWSRPVPSRPLAIPSPAFDRNPSYFNSNNANNNTSSNTRKSVTSPTSSWDSSVEDLTARKDDLEKRRMLAQSERLVEQETEKLEQLRLEEILTMCADYEKQVQWEKQNKPQQNRIKTNGSLGSLPRDKSRLGSPTSPRINKNFSFDSSGDVHGFDGPRQASDADVKCNKETGKAAELFTRSCTPPTPYSYSENPVTLSHPGSPRNRIKTILPSKENTRCEYSLEVIENRLALLNDYEITGPASLPAIYNNSVVSSSRSDHDVDTTGTTRVPITQTKEINCPNVCDSVTSNNDTKATLLPVNGNAAVQGERALTNGRGGEETVEEEEGEEHSNKPKSRAEEIAESKYEFLGFDPRKENELPPEDGVANNFIQKRMISNSTSSLNVPSSEEPKPPPAEQLQNGNSDETSASVKIVETQIKTSSLKRLKRFDTCPSWTNPTLDLGSFSSLKKNGECTAEQLISQLDAIIRGTQKSPSSALENGKFILPLPDPEKDTTETKSELVGNLTSLKAKVTDIEQQQEELMRESEIEQALLGGEWRAQNEKLSADESKLAALREKVQHCDREMERCAEQQAERQGQSRSVLEQQQAILVTLEQQLQNNDDEDLKPELVESLRQQQELLEAEKKAFEDLEFSLLEEEACWLSRREELQRDVSDQVARCNERRQRLQQLDSQRQASDQQAASLSHQLQLQRLSLLRQIEEARSRLKEMDVRQTCYPHTKMLPRFLQGEGENMKKQSQDDLDRISRVTSGAPMEVSTNSLGRRTIASLQEIERNRQIHLAKQGSLVIEEERKRVSELKRRVQDEARAEWEERRQREHNCHSLNSVGSDESSLTSHSDLPTESATSSEDVEKRLPPPPPHDSKTDSSTSENLTERETEERGGQESQSRPISDASSYSVDQLTVRMRNKSNSNLQRPLTRYLPIRGESLDLRQHIESAGHQVDLCPHVVLDKTSCRGFLQKMTSRFHQWNKRWFVFDRTRRTLTYYSDRSEKKQKGGAYFQAIEEVYVDHLNSVKSPNPQVTFVIKSSERTYHLVAPSPEAMRIWVDVIFTGAEGYQEFCPGL